MNILRTTFVNASIWQFHQAEIKKMCAYVSGYLLTKRASKDGFEIGQNTSLHC